MMIFFIYFKCAPGTSPYPFSRSLLNLIQEILLISLFVNSRRQDTSGWIHAFGCCIWLDINNIRITRLLGAIKATSARDRVGSSIIAFVEGFFSQART